MLLFPVKVQGQGSAEAIAKAIQVLNQEAHQLDLLIVGRGGGSIEDLWSFNEECVARAISESKIPIISAVGHQTDFTIADFVADRRAATPSQAAELAVPNIIEIQGRADTVMKNIVTELSHARKRSVERLNGLMRSSALRDPRALVRSRGQRLELSIERLVSRLTSNRDRQVNRLDTVRQHIRLLLSRALSPRKLEFQRVVSNLGLLDPLAILARGYGVITKGKEGSIVKSNKQVKLKDEIEVRLHEGRLSCQVIKTYSK